MIINFNSGSKIKAGDWVKIYNLYYRIIITKNDIEYAFIDPMTGEITTDWYNSVEDLLNGMDITEVIKTENIKVSCI